jgi:hypothetical protein
MSNNFSHLFAINGTWLYPPDGYQESPIPVVGYNLLGEPIRQGYQQFIFTWSIMKQDRLSSLINMYDPNNPMVNITFIDKKTGQLIVRSGMMEEPIVGARMIVYYQNVAVKFTRISDPI